MKADAVPGSRGWSAAVRSAARRAVEALLLFALLRLVVGIAVVALFSRDSVAWGWELTVIAVGAAAVYVAVALALRGERARL
jgi:hypothetical protein